MQFIDKLQEMRSYSNEGVNTAGLDDQTIVNFSKLDNDLVTAIDEAYEQFQQLKNEFPELLALNETDQALKLQSEFVNFYAEDAVNPYVSLAAKGPWIVTTKGAVVHDSGGYGMLGFGHGPNDILAAMNHNQVMANIMTPNFSQYRLTQALQQEIGHSRDNKQCPYSHFLCLNSGSESVTVAARMSDINAKLMTDPGGKHADKTIKLLALKGGFHGRTDRPAQASDSSLKGYVKHLASFRDRNNLLTVEPNNVEDLHRVFAQANKDNIFIEAMFMEPVMGEGNPGAAVSVEFYNAARQLTKTNDSLLMVDSIQAGLRAHGCLSIVDYPGFQQCEAPDMETYSKALNAGQYPLSVLAMNTKTAELYRKGVYGNTMTSNPRAMDIACAVLDKLDNSVRQNIQQRGKEFVAKLNTLAEELNGLITNVQGTGLLFSCELQPYYKSYGANSIEEYLRKKGIGVIHGGENSLRFTPHFNITTQEVDLIIDAVKDALINGPKIQAQEESFKQAQGM